MRMVSLAVLMAVMLVTAGCAESATMAGNGLSMLVACVLLWSTVNLGRRDAKRNGDDGLG